MIAIAMAAVVLVSSCAGEESSVPTNPDVVRAFVYELGEDPHDAAAFTGNELVFEARVDSVGVARLVAVNVDGTGLHQEGSDAEFVTYVYTPVYVEVTLVHRGELAVGQKVVVRYLGGQAGNTAFEVSGAPAADTYQPGTSLLLFTQEQVDVGDGVMAMTPNFVYVVKGGQARGAVSGAIIDLDSFRALIEAANR